MLNEVVRRACFSAILFGNLILLQVASSRYQILLDLLAILSFPNLDELSVRLSSRGPLPGKQVKKA